MASESGDEDSIFGPKCKILVKRATNLKNKVKFGTIDPYAEVTFENHTKKTKVKDDTKDPEWNEELEFPRGTSDTVKVQVKVFHEETFGDGKLLAYGTGTITGYTRSEWHDIEIKLIDSKQRPTEGVLSLGVGGGGGEGGEEEYDEEEEEEEDMEGEAEMDGDGEIPMGGGTKAAGRKKKRKGAGGRSTNLSAAVEEARAKINFNQLSAKDEAFQIRFVVHKARQLFGLVERPLVRIMINGKTQRTVPRRGTTPKFNETVIFSVTKSEKALLDLPIELSVVDSAVEPPYNLVGSYSFDLTVAWTERDRLLPYKWFALTNPDEPQDGMTGYLNMSMQIIKAGEEHKKLPKKSDTEIDVASNVFYPPGISLQPGHFVIKLYTGEDMPQMDSATLSNIKNLFVSGEKPADLVDPYAVFEFAGTKISSMVQQGTFDPVWNQKLVIKSHFPSMAESFVIRVMDSDDMAMDDLIATKLLKMTNISFSSTDSDLGFLPTFGPAYVPLYGSLREFSEVFDKYDHLNKGDDEGIGYRGRVLVEISTHMGEPDSGLKTKSMIAESDTTAVMSSLRRHKYHLFVSFDTGNMIKETDSQVEFEVSIGDHGNTLSFHGSSAPSSTQPCNAVYDGTYYHYMPWTASKPAVILHSQWEDVEFRAESYNLMTSLLEFMEEHIRRCKVLVGAYASGAVLQTKITEAVQSILEEMRSLELPELPEEATKLDQNLQKLRLYQLGKLEKPKDETPQFVGIDMGQPDSVYLDVETDNEEGDEAEPWLVLENNSDAEKENEKEKQFENLVEELEAMLTGRLKDERPGEKIKLLEALAARFKTLCIESQISVPDVFVWMMSGSNRIAYTRIPIHQIIHTANPKARGKLCGKKGSYFLKKPLKETIGAHLSMTVWFGKFEHVAESFKLSSSSEVTVYAESYENEAYFGTWGTKFLKGPNFSDLTRKYEIPKEDFKAPPGWEFDGDWVVSVDKSLSFDNEQGLSEFKEVAFEVEQRAGGTAWADEATEKTWQAESGEAGENREELVPCPDGWAWTGEWQLEKKRAVDSEGWEYTEDIDYENYGPIERNYHQARRRMWTRLRTRTEDDAKKKEVERDPEGWEYSKLFTTKFHPVQKSFDIVRRRRWNRKLTSDVPVPVVFSFQDGKKKSDKFVISPRVMIEFPEENIRKYQLRAYLYQARGLLGADQSGYSDPYARVIFGNRSGCTGVVSQTCSPLWDTSITLNNIEICGDREEIASNPPHIVIELFDDDRLVTHDRLGRVVCKPRIIVNADDSQGTKLDWFPVHGTKRSKGEILAAFELYEIGPNGTVAPALSSFGGRTPVPPHIRPHLTPTRVEILTWGLRKLLDYNFQTVDSPHLEIEIGGATLAVDKIKSVKKHCNFENPHNYIDIMLPEEELYMPPINIRVFDNRNFGFTPLIGVCTIKEYSKYRTSLQALQDLKDHLERVKESGNADPLGVANDGGADTPTESLTEKDLSDTEERTLITPQEKGMDLGDIEMGIEIHTPKPPAKQGLYKGKSASTKNLIENDELGALYEAAEKPEEKVAPVKEEDAPVNPDDILVSDWWSKYYESLGMEPRLQRIFNQRKLPKIRLYERELEEYFDGFNDLMESYPIQRPDNEISDGDGDSSSDEDDEDWEHRHRVGYFKGSLKVYSITEEMYEESRESKEMPQLLFSNLPTNNSVDVLVRVYVVAAIGLTALDFGGSADPYLELKCGKTQITDKSDYITKNLNPVFGRLFQIKAKLPRDSHCTVKVYDHDLIGANDLIGQTTIDLEDRFLSWRRASCGLSQQYIRTRGNKDRWRDFLKPVDILKRTCLLKGWVKPVFQRSSSGLLGLVVNGETFNLKKGAMQLGEDAKVDSKTEKQQLALQVLHELGAVPEHVETRTLYNEDCPGIPQGKLHMWVDIFPFGDQIPPPISIRPREPQKYTLRCIVYNTEDVILEDTNIMGEQMSDIYVKTYLEGRKKESQETDVHFRSLTGEGNFNWRMCYDMEFIIQENKMVQKKKGKFWHIEKAVKKVDPTFYIEVYDKDILSRDDLLGSTELDLTRLPAPSKTAEECTLEVYERDNHFSLFDRKKISGFWPVYSDALGTRELTGKVEMELEILTEEEAVGRPAGVARNEPNTNPTLEPPNRPDTSFNWFTNPWKVFKVLVWRKYKWYILLAVLIILVILFLVLMFYTAPEAINSAIWN